MNQELQAETAQHKKPDDETNTRFKKAIQGYSVTEVDLVVKRLKKEIRFLTARNEEQSREIEELSARNQQLERAPKSGDMRTNNTENLLLIVESAKVTADQVIASAKNESEELMTEAKITLMDAAEKAQEVMNNAKTEAEIISQRSSEEARTVLADAKEKSQEMISSARADTNAIRRSVENKLTQIKKTFSDISDISKSTQTSMLGMFAEIDNRTSEALAEIRNSPSTSEVSSSLSDNVKDYFHSNGL